METIKAEAYIVGAGDTLKILVYDHPDLETTVRVSAEQDVLLPLLGRTQVKGLTVPQIADKIARLLADGYLVNPQVNVLIEEFRSKKVVILGSVDRPGVYELSGATNLLELLSKAGGLTEDAGEMARITSQENVGSTTKTRSVNVQSLFSSGNRFGNVAVKDGDHIYIEKAGVCYVTGEVTRPGVYKIDDKSTVIKAVTLAGGFTINAYQKNVSLIRVINGEKKTLLEIPLDYGIQPEDIIIVTESFF